MSDPSDDSMVLVTGASGYIASHIVKQLLEKGHHVRGTVRSLKNQTKVKPLRDLCPNAKHPLDLVEADLMSADCWDKAVEGCKFVLHTASPFLAKSPRDESELIRPAVDGTLHVLRACHKHRVQRVVLTSSIAAVSGGFGDRNKPGKVYTEDDWIDTTVRGMDPYIKSKALAEKAAWDFVKELPEEERFELAVINPSYVMGPVLSGGDATSMELPRRLMTRDMPMVPKIFQSVCDVRDVAEAHVSAMLLPDAAGHRHIIASEGLWFKQIAQIIDKEFRAQGYKIPTTESPNFLMSIAGLFDGSVKMLVPFLGMEHHYDTTRMKTVLGIPGIAAQRCIVDMCYSLVERGFVKKSSKYTGPPQG